MIQVQWAEWKKNAFSQVYTSTIWHKELPCRKESWKHLPFQRRWGHPRCRGARRPSAPGATEPSTPWSRFLRGLTTTYKTSWTKCQLVMRSIYLAFEGDSSRQETFPRQVHWLPNAGMQVRLRERFWKVGWFLSKMRVLTGVRNGLICSMESEFGKGERAKSDWKEEKDPSRMGGKWFEEMREVKKEVKRGKSEEKWSNTWVENWPPGQSWLNGVCTDTKASTSAQTVTTVFSGNTDVNVLISC